MSSGTPSPIDAYSPVNTASPIIAASPVSTPPSLAISVTSPVRRKSPVSTTTSHTVSPVHHVTSRVKRVNAATSPPTHHTASPALIASPINSISPPVAESPESRSSTFSTVYSPAELLNSTGANIDTDSCRNGIKVRRQRLRPWLINQINSGEIPGLVWLDKENMVFKIPWKHFGRPGVDMYMDALLFRRWALHTKKFEQGRPSDISTWKTRFRCALHKLPDIEELNDQNQTEGDEPYRVYKFRKIELETVPAQLQAQSQAQDDEPESSIGSVGSPVSTPYSVENMNMSSGVDTYRAPVTTVYSAQIGRNNEHLPHKTGGVFPKQEVIDKYVGYTSPTPRKRHPHKLGGMPATDIQKWQYYDHIRIREAYPDEKSDDCGYDAEDEVARKMSSQPKPQNSKEDHKYQQGMDYETDDDDASWNSRGCVQINQPIQSVPSIVSRYPLHYTTENTSVLKQQRGFEPYERRYSTESTAEVGVIKNLKTTAGAKRTTPTDKDGMYDEQDDNDLFFQSCAKRIKKLDTKSSGYLKLKILEHFYYVENFQQSQNYYNQSYRYRTDPPPLISNANSRTTEQVIDVDDSMQGIK